MVGVGIYDPGQVPTCPRKRGEERPQSGRPLRKPLHRTFRRVETLRDRGWDRRVDDSGPDAVHTHNHRPGPLNIGHRPPSATETFVKKTGVCFRTPIPGVPSFVRPSFVERSESEEGGDGRWGSEGRSESPNKEEVHR